MVDSCSDSDSRLDENFLDLTPIDERNTQVLSKSINFYGKKDNLLDKSNIANAIEKPKSSLL